MLIKQTRATQNYVITKQRSRKLDSFKRAFMFKETSWLTMVDVVKNDIIYVQGQCCLCDYSDCQSISSDNKN